MNKKEIREYIQKQLNSNVDENEDATLINNLFKNKNYKQANTIGISMSMNQELDTSKIIQHAISHNKKVVIPKTFTNHEMKFYEYSQNTNLKKSPFGVLEPMNSNIVRNEDIDLLIVPGLGFNLNNYRIGYGGGFYDKYLATYNGYTVSLVRKIQLIDNLDWDIEDFDIKVDELILKESISENK